MATVPMLAPDGTSGEIPQDKVQDAIKAGFKQAVEMTSPDGKKGYIPLDRQQDAMKAGFRSSGISDLSSNPKSEGTYKMTGPQGNISVPFSKVSDAKQMGFSVDPTDISRYDKDAGVSLFQKAKDNFNAATQGAKTGDSGVKSVIEDIGAGGGDVIRSLAHPIDTLNAMTSHPEASFALAAHALGDDTAINKLNETPNPSLARTVGQIGTGAILGEAAGRLAGPALNAARKGVSKAILLGKTPEEAYESALKPSTTLSPEERSAVIKTGLENEIPVSKGGLEKLSDKIEGLNQAIKDEIASDPNRPIDPNKVATRTDLVKGKFANQVNAQGDLNAIESSKQQFLEEQGAKPGQVATPPRPTGLLDAQGNPVMDSGTPSQPPTPAPPMNAVDAQKMKQGTYRVLSGKFGEQGSASVEAQKALARGLKEEIANQFPEISKLNADESRLLDLQPVLEKAVNRISNQQAVGIGTPIAGAATKAVTGSGSAGVVASILKSVLDNPNVKSRLAIAISRSSKIPIAQAMQRVQAYSVSLGSTAGALQGYSSGANPSPESNQ